MTFDELILDIKKLEGIRLSSIRPGADIYIEVVDPGLKKIVVRNVAGKRQSRSFIEFQKIWEALAVSRVVRVEEVLGGAGSSRNQPETIFANLPYIEWLKIDNKKCISLSASSSHPFGTLKKMDAIQAAQLSESLNPSADEHGEIILISREDIVPTTNQIQNLLGKKPIADEPGVYLFSQANATIICIDARKGVPVGTFFEIEKSTNEYDGEIFSILNHKYAIQRCNGLKLFRRV